MLEKEKNKAGNRSLKLQYMNDTIEISGLEPPSMYLCLDSPLQGFLAASQEVLNMEPGFHTLDQPDDDWLYERGKYWIERYSTEG